MDNERNKLLFTQLEIFQVRLEMIGLLLEELVEHKRTLEERTDATITKAR